MLSVILIFVLLVAVFLSVYAIQLDKEVQELKHLAACERLAAFNQKEYAEFLQVEMKNSGVQSSETYESFLNNYVWPNGESDVERLEVVYSEMWGE